MINEVVIWCIGKLMCVCVLVFVFKCGHSWGVVPIPVDYLQEKDQRGGCDASIRFTHLGGLKG